MKRSLAIIALLASGFLLSAAAQTPAAPAAPAGPAKIAVVAFEVAVAQTNEGQRNFADLQKKYAPKEAELKASGEEIDKLTDELKAQGDKLSMAERASRAATIDEKKKVLERSVTDLRTDANQEVQEMLSALASKVYDVLAGYARQQGYTLVLDIAQQQSPVLYAQPSINITKAIIDEYNQKSGVPAPVAAPAAPKPAAKAPGAAH
jgi:outer membrane protein